MSAFAIAIRRDSFGAISEIWFRFMDFDGFWADQVLPVAVVAPLIQLGMTFRSKWWFGPPLEVAGSHIRSHRNSMLWDNLEFLPTF